LLHQGCAAAVRAAHVSRTGGGESVVFIVDAPADEAAREARDAKVRMQASQSDAAPAGLGGVRVSA